jgi:hypothetical protein
MVRSGGTPERIAVLASDPRRELATGVVRSLKTAVRRWQ